MASVRLQPAHQTPDEHEGMSEQTSPLHHDSSSAAPAQQSPRSFPQIGFDASSIDWARVLPIAALVAILLWQALRGQSVMRPEGATLELLVVWLVISVIALTVALRRRTFSPTTTAAVHL